MPPSTLHTKLLTLRGRYFDYLSSRWQLIDVLADEDKVVLQRADAARHLQSDQFGQGLRHAPQTLTLPISDAGGEAYSDELLILLQGRV